MSHNYVILSDLHLSEGVDPDAHQYFRNEDFLFDQEFSNFVDYLLRSPHELPWHLIFNGDLFDFLQVTTTQDAPAEFLDPKNVKYGLDCGEQESVFKLRCIFRGHPVFFAALARFCEFFPVTLVSGNHDIELFYPAVRKEFLCLLQKASGSSSMAAFRNVHFEDWLFYRRDLLLILHGHMFDPLNCFMFPLEPRLPVNNTIPAAQQDHIDLPWGSIFVRYFFNRLEEEYPFSDNIRPTTHFPKWLIRKRPLLALRFLLRDGRELIAKLRTVSRSLPPLAYSSRGQSHDERLQELSARLSEEAGCDTDLISLKLRQTAALGEVSVLRKPYGRMGWFLRFARLGYPAALLLLLASLFISAIVLAVSPLIFLLAAGVLLWMLTHRKAEVTPADRCRAAATKIQKIWRVRFVAMGHSHYADAQLLNSGAFYFNTGTWTRLFEYPPVSILPEENELVFLKIMCERGAPSAQLLKWIDGDGPRPVKLFQPTRKTYA
ncbi:MAG: hypothetical protein HY645_11510 [Acidobacteria bacterium]|nr:hypothetical protein [Acidobacteriota bacterium]